eukprot:60402_1
MDIVPTRSLQSLATTAQNMVESILHENQWNILKRLSFTQEQLLITAVELISIEWLINHKYRTFWQLIKHKMTNSNETKQAEVLTLLQSHCVMLIDQKLMIKYILSSNSKTWKLFLSTLIIGI